MSTAALTWTCPTCLVDSDESYCGRCGLDLGCLSKGANHAQLAPLETSHEIDQPVAATPSGSTAATGLGGQ